MLKKKKQRRRKKEKEKKKRKEKKRGWRSNIVGVCVKVGGAIGSCEIIIKM